MRIKIPTVCPLMRQYVWTSGLTDCGDAMDVACVLMVWKPSTATHGIHPGSAKEGLTVLSSRRWTDLIGVLDKDSLKGFRTGQTQPSEQH